MSALHVPPVVDPLRLVEAQGVPTALRSFQAPTGSALSPLGNHLAFAALGLEAADPAAVENGALTAMLETFADVLDLAHFPGRALAFSDLAVAHGPRLMISIGLGVDGRPADAVAEAALWAQTALGVLARLPFHRTGLMDPSGLLVPGLVARTARVQRHETLAPATVCQMSEFDPLVTLVGVLSHQPVGTRARTTMLATVADAIDIDRAMAAIDAAMHVHQVSGVEAERAEAEQDALAAWIPGLGFIAELALVSPAPIPDVLVAAAARALIRESPGPWPRTVFTRDYAVERDLPGLAAALAIGVPLRGGLGPRSTGDLVSLDEAAGSVRWPLPAVAGLPTMARRAARTLPTPAGIVPGAVVGRDSAGADVAMPDAVRSNHLHVIGAPGAGKSAFLARLVEDDLRRRRPFALIDPHGDLADYALALAHQVRRPIVVVDPAHAATMRVELSEDAKLDALAATCARGAQRGHVEGRLACRQRQLSFRRGGRSALGPHPSPNG